MKMMESFFERVENSVGKGELLVTSNFSFSHSVSRRLVLQARKIKGLFGKGLMPIFTEHCPILNSKSLKFQKYHISHKYEAGLSTKRYTIRVGPDNNSPMSVS